MHHITSHEMTLPCDYVLTTHSRNQWEPKFTHLWESDFPEGQALCSFGVQPFQTLICGNFHGTFDYLSSLTFESSGTLEEIKLQFTIMEYNSTVNANGD